MQSEVKEFCRTSVFMLHLCVAMPRLIQLHQVMTCWFSRMVLSLDKAVEVQFESAQQLIALDDDETSKILDYTNQKNGKADRIFFST